MIARMINKMERIKAQLNTQNRIASHLSKNIQVKRYGTLLQRVSEKSVFSLFSLPLTLWYYVKSTPKRYNSRKQEESAMKRFSLKCHFNIQNKPIIQKKIPKKY